MLIQLDIENVAVIERASIEFDTGLNTITGETGAGKSLLINSLNMVLGCRSTREIIREGADFAKVSAVFFSKDIDSVLEEAGISSDEGNVVVTRKLYRDGRNVCHINGSAVNVSLLRTIGEKLVVIHGQHDSGALMDTSTHIAFLDAFAKNTELLSEYKTVYAELRSVQKQLSQLDSDIESRKNEIDYLTYQTDEIEKAELSVHEDDELSERKTILENAELINDYARNSYTLLNGDGGARNILYDAKRLLEKLSDIDASIIPHCEKANELFYETEELARDVSSYLSKIEFNPSELEKINDRLNLINSLKRKYGGSIEDILDYYDNACRKLETLSSFDENKEKLEKRKEELYKTALNLSERLTKSRKESALLLSERLTHELENLDMPKCIIEFSFFPSALYENGAEHIELYISTNGDTPKSMEKIASGGEISRIMLAIKSVFSDFDKIPTLLFDEIDTGVSGRAAEKIGLKMKSLSENYQLICVTHLPIIASCATHHLLLEKKFDASGARTQIRTLSYPDRVREIARIISGENISDIALENAKQMLLLHNPRLKEEF